MFKWFHIHKWSKWGQPQNGVRVFIDSGKRFKVYIQYKKCKTCGKVKLREVS